MPSAFVEMAQLPRTLNGKIDRKALPAMEQVRAGRESQDDSRPGTPLEEILAGLWGEVLQLGQVGVNENFFELGGHSLLATQVMSRITQSLGVEMPLRAKVTSGPAPGGPGGWWGGRRTCPLTPGLTGGSAPKSSVRIRAGSIPSAVSACCMSVMNEAGPQT